MNIAVYATDHGWGHVTRQLAWIEKIDWKKDDKVFFVNSMGIQLVTRSKLNNLIPVNRKTDPGLVTNNRTFKVDPASTKKNLIKWYDEVEKIQNIEKNFLEKNKIDLVISDISPHIFPVAEELGITSLALSSFDWHWVYKDLYRENHFDLEAILDDIGKWYRKASDSYLLPLGNDGSVYKNIKKIPLIARVDDNKTDGYDPGNVTVSMGYSVFPDLNEKLSSKYRYHIPQHLIRKKLDNVNIIPENKVNIQEYYKSSDFVITKTGYSSVAECIALKKPIIGIMKHDNIEDFYIGTEINNKRIGESYYYEDLDRNVIDSFDHERYHSNYDKLCPRYNNTGWIYVQEFIEENRRN